VTDALDELDYGGWSGRSFSDLAGDRGWQRWNERRGSSRPPFGESIADVRSRVMLHVSQRSLETQGGVMVTHAEVIRTLLLVASGLAPESWPAIDVAPASVTRLVLRGGQIALAEIAGGAGVPERGP
jgi:broad specificity phosphatase PhoE